MDRSGLKRRTNIPNYQSSQKIESSGKNKYSFTEPNGGNPLKKNGEKSSQTKIPTLVLAFIQLNNCSLGIKQSLTFHIHLQYKTNNMQSKLINYYNIFIVMHSSFDYFSIIMKWMMILFHLYLYLFDLVKLKLPYCPSWQLGIQL